MFLIAGKTDKQVTWDSISLRFSPSLATPNSLNFSSEMISLNQGHPEPSIELFSRINSAIAESTPVPHRLLWQEHQRSTMAWDRISANAKRSALSLQSVLSSSSDPAQSGLPAGQVSLSLSN
jgi:hypothetical protein